MYTEASNEAKKAVVSSSVTTTAKLTFSDYYEEGKDLVIEKNITSDGISLKDYCSKDGKLIGMVSSKELELKVSNDDYDLDGKEFKLELGIDVSRQAIEGFRKINVTTDDLPDGKSTQDTRDGKNKFNLDYIRNSSAFIKTDTGMNLVNAWVIDIFSTENVLKTFKPKTTYTMKVKAKVVSKPSTIVSHNLAIFMLYRPNSSELEGVWKSVLEMPDKETIALNTEREYITSFTTPADMTDVRFLSYTFYGNNDGSTTGTAKGEIDVSEIMLVEGKYTAENFPDFELYGVSPSPDYPSEIKSIGDDINLINDADIINGSLSSGNIVSGYGYRLVTNNPIPVKSSTDYNINFRNIGEFKGVRVGIHSYDAEGNFISDSGWVSFTNLQATIKTGANWKSVRFVFSFSKTSTSVTTGETEYTGNITPDEFKTFKVKFQEGSKATGYSKYGEGTLNIEQSSKNKLINSSFRENWTDWWTSNTGTTPIEITEKLNQKCLHITGELQKTKTVAQNIQTRLEKGKTYTLSGMVYLENFVSGNTNSYISFYTDGKTTTGGWTNGLQVLSGHTGFNPSLNDYSKGFVKVTATLKVLDDTDLTKALGLYIYARDFTGDLYVYDVQLEESTEATDYEEYFNNTYTLPLSEPLRSLPNGVKDALEVDGIHRSVGFKEFNGSSDEGWILNNTDKLRYPFGIDISDAKVTPTVTEANNILSNQFIANATSEDSEAYKDIATFRKTTYNQRIWFFVPKTYFTKTTSAEILAEFKTMIANNPIQILYELANKTTEPYTDEQKEVLADIKRGNYYIEGNGNETPKGIYKFYNGENYEYIRITDALESNEDGIKDILYGDGRLIRKVKENKTEKLNVIERKEDYLYEEIPYGKFIVYSYSDTKSNNKYKLIANDFFVKLNPDFLENKAFNPTFPIKAKNFYEQFMLSYGIEVEEQTLPNENFIIDEMPNFDGYTGRTILGKLAELFGSFAKMNRNNKCQMYLKTQTDIVIDRNCMNSTLEIDKRYGPVNVISIGMSNVEGENVTLRDEESILENGETMIRIDDNPFLYTEALREQAIQDLYNRLHNFLYIPTKFKGKALLYSDCGDAVKVQNMNTTTDEYVDTIILNQDISLPITRKSTCTNLALNNTEQKLQYISKTKQEKSRAEIIVDKQNKLIQSVVSITKSLSNNLDILSIDMQKKLSELGQNLSDYQVTVSTQFEQTNKDFNFLFNNIIEQINSTSENTSEKFAEIVKYIRFEDGNIILGRSDNELILKQSNDRISFIQNGNEVAYFSNNKLYVKEIEVTESLYLGNFAFIPESNGSLSFKKVRG